MFIMPGHIDKRYPNHLPPPTDAWVATVRSLMPNHEGRCIPATKADQLIIAAAVSQRQQHHAPHVTTPRGSHTPHVSTPRGKPAAKAGFKQRLLATFSKSSSNVAAFGSGSFHSGEAVPSAAPSPWPSVSPLESLLPSKTLSSGSARPESQATSPSASPVPALALHGILTAELSPDDANIDSGESSSGISGPSSSGISDATSKTEEAKTSGDAGDELDPHVPDTTHASSPTPSAPAPSPALRDTLAKYNFPQSPEFHPCHSWRKVFARRPPGNAEGRGGYTGTSSSLRKRFPWVCLGLRTNSVGAEAARKVRGA